MLAELTEPATHDRIVGKDDLVFEPKYDGIRALVDLQVAPEIRVSIYSRLGNDKSDQFPELVEPLARLALRLKHPVLLDGEIVATDDKGHALGFQHLQGRLHVRGLSRHRSSRAVSVAFIAFDLLRDGADDIRALPFAGTTGEARNSASSPWHIGASADREHSRWGREDAGEGRAFRVGGHRRQGPQRPLLLRTTTRRLAEAEVHHHRGIRRRWVDGAPAVETPLWRTAAGVCP